MTKKIFRAIMLAVTGVLLSSVIIILGVLYSYTDSIQKKQLKDELMLAAVGTAQDGEKYLEQVKSIDYRLTWIAADGTVLGDTLEDAAVLPNHADREEIKAALADGWGESERESSTRLERTVYMAMRLDDGTVLRISVTRRSAAAIALGMLQPICAVLLIAIVIAVIIARRMSENIVTPLNTLDLDNPLENDVYEELSPLLTRISRQHKQIDEQLAELSRKAAEFEQITGNMQEGLVLLDKDGIILSINSAAKKVFNAHSSCVGKDFLNIDRSRDVTEHINAALEAGHSEMTLGQNEREYTLIMSRIDDGGEPQGVVILVFDITEKAFAERLRREFTANVSHELKTPLQSIIGSAELMENGLVPQDNLPHFAGLIHKEGQRLLTLIDDIIRLSQLDEGAELEKEEIDIKALLDETAAVLADSARKRDITISVEGESTTVTGVRRLLAETVYNLCDNAVKYNVDGGSVTLSVSETDSDVSITVSDTGIGIPTEYHDRVFERFFRVDKSHSKASGGTGLGLSIVKHAVQYHHGQIKVKNNPDGGTKITVTLPKSV